MSQELHVLQCYSCETFQVHIVKKTNKWECKICGEKQSIKKVFGRGSGKDCRAHVQRLNEDKRRKETFVLNRKIQVQCAENVVGTETNVRNVASSKWNKYLSEEEDDDDDDDDDAVIMPPSELRIGGTSKVCKQQTIQNYSDSDIVNNICGEKIAALPEKWSGKLTHLNERAFNETKEKQPHVSESSSPYFSTENDTYIDCKSGAMNSVCKLQRNSSPLCFTLLPEISTNTALLNCDSEQEIIFDFSSDSSVSNRRTKIIGKEQLPMMDVGDVIPPTSEMNRQEEKEATVQLQSHVRGSYVTNLGSEAINLEKNTKKIFSDKCNEDELDEILKL